ncbi:cytochrome-c peroxidase [Mucilaginibacter endophyticus]|uniref:cytochrome-c peroxidase n=1 Tax=Mucilaginibacter endophyticus TaxID=2675003 RepID=UPI000E0D77A0|nr:cytochrome c peroxidase [Mucilaginibacter endophyticus]
MKKAIFIFPLLAIVGFTTLDSLQKTPASNRLLPAEMKICSEYNRKVNELDSFLAVYPHYFPDSTYSIRKKKYQELAFRLKEVSGILLYFKPKVYYDSIAGPFHFTKANSDQKGIFKEIPDSFILTGPLGIDSDSDIAQMNKDDIQSEQAFIRRASQNYRKVFDGFSINNEISQISDSRLMDALHKEIFRISVSDLGNADFIIDTASMPALRGAVHGWIRYVQPIVDMLPRSAKPLKQRWRRLAYSCELYLSKNQDFYAFDRMVFLKKCVFPLTACFHDVQLGLKIPFYEESGAIRSDAVSLYEANAIMPNFFEDGTEGRSTLKREQLGELLFFDPLLSGNNKRSCASCHRPEKAFTDGLAKGLSFDKKQLPRNTSTIITAGFQNMQFWDERAVTLEDQMDTVLNSPTEMHSSFSSAILKLNHSPEYVRLFREAFPGRKGVAITRDAIKHALSVYQRSLSGMNTRFDAYMSGKEGALSVNEISGFNLFMGKAKCGVCHFAPLFNGSLPPFYTMADHHSDGVPESSSLGNHSIDPDLGVARHTNNRFDQFSFKTPTLRNIVLTGPYMHNGVYSSLKQVLDFYDKGAGANFRPGISQQLRDAGLPPVGLTILPVPLHLNEKEKSDIIAFLGSLTDAKTGFHRIKKLPAMDRHFSDFNGRKIGGYY